MSEVDGMSLIERWDEHDPEVTSAAIALAAYHGDAEQDADDWVAAAKVALDATNYKGVVDLLAELYERILDVHVRGPAGRIEALRDALKRADALTAAGGQ